MKKELIEKLHGIANIENEYYSNCCGHWLSLEEQLEMARAYDDDTDSIMKDMLTRENRIVHFLITSENA